jgi:hypothetical protein
MEHRDVVLRAARRAVTHACDRRRAERANAQRPTPQPSPRHGARGGERNVAVRPRASETAHLPASPARQWWNECCSVGAEPRAHLAATPPPHLPTATSAPPTAHTTAHTLYFSCHAACSGSVMSTATSECGLAGAPAARGKKSAMERCAPPRGAVATRAPRRRRKRAGAATAREPSSSSKRDGGSAGRQGQGQGGAGERDLRSQAGRNGRVAPARRGSGCCNVTAQAAATHSAGRQDARRLG